MSTENRDIKFIKGIGEKRLDLVMETVETYLMEGVVEEKE